ncbi:MAG: M23 family metallopeptidase [Gammaproteobacteria bacterium]|nr:M23 family metallopeptidase [Gammaproteobacteria bacterium]MDH5652711.1 M23 family metallopeptidase [Gammaproteobacteria bacterium]
MGLILPEQPMIPVQGATKNDWNRDSFWHYPWGKSVVHKGIDVFAPIGTPVISSSYGLVIYTGTLEIGGNAVAVLGPGWRVHYYSHLHTIDTRRFRLVETGELLGTVGKSGNAAKRPPHLHYTIISLLPRLWRWDSSRQGWKKIFILNPADYLPKKNKIKKATGDKSNA